MTEKKYHPVICFGESLWDIVPENKLAGGAPVNVAYHLQKLGKNPAVISRVGYDKLGSELVRFFEAKGVCTDYFQIDYSAPTSTVLAEVKPGDETLYDILKDVAWDHISYENTLATLTANADYFVFGSLASRSRQTRETLFHLLASAKTKVLDINLRTPFYNRNIITQLLDQTDILKLNLEELELITGWFSSFINAEDRIKALKEHFELKTIIVTKGAKGAVLNSGENFYQCQGIPVTVMDTIGSGDAFLAAILSKMIDNVPIAESLEFANRLAAFITTKKGGCPEYELSDVNV